MFYRLVCTGYTFTYTAPRIFQACQSFCFRFYIRARTHTMIVAPRFIRVVRSAFQRFLRCLHDFFRKEDVQVDAKTSKAQQESTQSHPDNHNTRARARVYIIYKL